ncbi:hypothetical protein [Achromobacter pestifer]|uniref:Uncharacterized protein n=1 Tax=Achromobacter pestifer TaxID=1353889 RepID=A0A6S6YWN5_9BURK|nr:hypothetical protein [Achromobacter pestifer]CAB3643133.1 hypothetical protein LMG3431_02295 [Achromobacter pestifer]
MYCQQCGAAHSGSQRLCAECQRILNGISKPSVFDAGDGGFPIHGSGDAGIEPSDERKAVRRKTRGAERVEVIPTAYKGKPSTTAEFRKYGTVGTVLCVFGFVVISHTAWWLVLLLPSLFAMKVGWALKDKRFYRFAWLFNVEANRSGHIFLTRIGGQCPDCTGELALEDDGFGKWRKTMIQCNHDPRHRWLFVPDVLDDL